MTMAAGVSAAAVAAVVLFGAPALALPVNAMRAAERAFEESESARLTRAKDLISDEQWLAAIAELRAAIDDPKERSRDEALFWLAHSQNQVGDLAEAVESIQRLQREFHKSRWSAPAYSLLIEVAQKLGRRDVLWRMVPPPPPPSPAAPARAPRPPRTAGPAPAPPAASPATPPAAPAAVTPAPPPLPGEPPVSWLPQTFAPDAELRIQALGRLIRTDATKVIPILGSIALEHDDPAAARRAVFVLAQSRNPHAHELVVDVAKRGPEPVRVAAVRELGRFGGPEVAQQLLQVYWSANVPVKEQVVISLGQRSEANALVKIAQSESDRQLQESALIALGRAGAYQPLRELYPRISSPTRRAIIRGLFTAGDEDGLIRIAEQEKDPALRAYVLERLRLMDTPRAKAYLASIK